MRAECRFTCVVFVSMDIFYIPQKEILKLPLGGFWEFGGNSIYFTLFLLNPQNSLVGIY
jgi:hypothetical protein